MSKEAEKCIRLTKLQLAGLICGTQRRHILHFGNFCRNRTKIVLILLFASSFTRKLLAAPLCLSETFFQKEDTIFPRAFAKGFSLKSISHLHLHIFTFAHLHLHIYISAHLHICTSVHLTREVSYLAMYTHIHVLHRWFKGRSRSTQANPNTSRSSDRNKCIHFQFPYIAFTSF